jgi:hypothetical protein
MGDPNAFTPMDGYSTLGTNFTSRVDLELEAKRQQEPPIRRAFWRAYKWISKDTRAVMVCLVLTGLATGLLAVFVEFGISALSYCMHTALSNTPNMLHLFLYMFRVCVVMIVLK